MAGESRNEDLKIKIDIQVAAEKLELIKNIAAIANSGGGKIILGKNEKKSPGISVAETKQLDSARVADLVSKYIKPSQVHVGHTLKRVKKGRFLLTLNISRVTYPVVFSKQGFDPIANRPVFRVGDVWTRHSSKTEPIEHEDLRLWIEAAKGSAINQMKDRLRIIAEAPEDADIKAVTRSGKPISSPEGFLENESNLRLLNKDHLIEPFYLTWLFLHRANLKVNKKELALLIASSLRRNSTLYWWLVEADEFPKLIKEELFAVVIAGDRDKSDAAKSIIDVGSVYLNSRDMERLVRALSDSNYSHFKRAARSWRGKAQQKAKLRKRTNSAKTHSGGALNTQKLPELRAQADLLAGEILDQKSNQLARKLSEVNFVIWSKRTKRI
ncbi:MAG: hypothetical protein WD740_06715 [Anaerolineales bacterium]